MKNSTQEKQNLTVRLSGYAAAAGAIIALAPSANAQVMWSGSENIDIPLNSSYQLDIDNDGILDFRFALDGSFFSKNSYSSFSSFTYSWHRYASAYVMNSGSGMNYNSWVDHMYRPKGFDAGNLIDNAQTSWRDFLFASDYGKLANGRASYSRTYFTSWTHSSSHSGDFAGQSKFLGVRFYIGDKQHYGWVRANLSDNMADLNIIDWGYQAVSDSGIVAGGIEPEFVNDSLYNIDTVEVGLNFPIQVQNLVAGDFVVTNGVVTNLSEVVAGEQFLVKIKATADGKVGLTIPVDSVDNSEGLFILAKSTSFNVDTHAPLATIDAGVTTTNNKKITITITFNEKITGLDLSDFVLTNCALTSLHEVNPGTKYTFYATATAGGPVNIQLPAAAVNDLAGNGNVVASENYTYNPPVSVEDITTDDIVIYPNPVRSDLHIRLDYFNY